MDELDITSFVCPINPIVPSKLQASESGRYRKVRRVLRSATYTAERISEVFNNENSAPRERILISRKNAKFRKITNENDLYDILKTHGFKSVVMEDLTLSQQLQLMRNAEFVIGPHGAGMAHMLSCRPGTHLIELSARQYVVRAVNNFAPVAQVTGVDYHIIYCDENGDPTAKLIENEGNDIIVGEKALREIESIITSRLS